MRSIGIRFGLVIGALVAIFLVLILVRSFRTADRNSKELVAQQARLALEFDLAIRSYIADHVRPAVAEHLGPDEFEVETMSTSFAARSVFEKVRRNFPEYIIKFSSDNPRNPANQAGPEELEVIRYFNENPEAKIWQGEIDLGGKPYYAVFGARRMETGCLRCHGVPEDAPESMIEDYGAEAGFGRPVGTVIALDTIAVPLEKTTSGLIYRVAQDTLISAVALALLLVGTILTFRRLVSRRLARFVGHLDATGEKLEPIPEPAIKATARDEIDLLGTSFNVLAHKLRTLRDTLEQRVESRTEELTRANRRLHEEVAVRRETEAKLSRAKVAAEEANEAKSQFLTNVSHEIRTPMNGIMGMTQLALETDLDEEQEEYLTLVKQSAGSLLGIIEDILDFSKIEAGRLELQPSEFGLHDEIRTTLASLDSRADARGNDLVYRIAPDVPAALVGDRVRLRQIVTNLVGNAIKFTEDGEVVLEATLGERDGGRVRLDVEVRDTGIGFPEEMCERIFDEFQQVDGSATREHGGTGLGLAICRRLVELLGGEIRAESEVGRGSRFRFSAWFDESLDAPAPRDRSEDLAGRSILLVEDGESTRAILADWLESWGARVTSVGSAAEALNALWGLGSSPDDLVVEADLAGGSDVLTAYLESGREAERVVMLTRTGRSKTATPGMVGAASVVKPLRPRDLRRALLRRLKAPDRPDAAGAAGPPPRDATARPYRVLVVEDNRINRRVARRILEKKGYLVHAVEDGRAAVEAVTAGEYDAVLMDIQMPVLDGIAATREIRAGDGAGAHVPIIALTAHATKEDALVCLEAGMDGYVAKPVDAAELLDALKRVLDDGPAT